MLVDMEFVRIGVEALTPLSIAGVGWIVSYRLRSLEQKQWGAQKLTEKRISIYDEVAPKLNQILCYAILVGQWQSVEAKTIIALKREVDARIHGHRFLLGPEVYADYRKFMKLVFDTDDFGAGPTRLKIVVNNGLDYVRQGAEDRRTDIDSFSIKTVERNQVKDAYFKLGQSFINSFNITPGPLEYNKSSSIHDDTFSISRLIS